MTENGKTSNENGRHPSEDVAIGVEDVSTIPKGTVDPIYEAKARVLNRAVNSLNFTLTPLVLF